MTYIVTMELKTPIWKKFLRWFRIIAKKQVFELYLDGDFETLKKGDVLYGGYSTVLILSADKDEN